MDCYTTAIRICLFTCGSMGLLGAGCSRSEPVAPVTVNADLAPLRAALKLAAEPAGAQQVIEARDKAEHGQEVVVTGRIGGSLMPWVEGSAAFSIVDASLKACSDTEGDNCPTPWDYCCLTDQLPKAILLVKFVDAQGQLIPHDARQLFGLQELQTVVVQGTADRDEAGNLTVVARGLFVRSEPRG